MSVSSFFDLLETMIENDYISLFLPVFCFFMVFCAVSIVRSIFYV